MKRELSPEIILDNSDSLPDANGPMSNTPIDPNIEKQPIQPEKENGLLNILFNVVIPVIILNKGSAKLGPATALVVALLFPLCFGLYDLWKKRKWNPFSILGFINVTVTGSLALAGLGGIWFSIKEAFFPLIIGIFVWLSAKKDKPLVQTFLLNAQTMNLDLIDAKLEALQKRTEFHQHLVHSTRLLSFSFFLSAVLNFVLAQHIFKPLGNGLSEVDRSIELNQQIAQMTSYSAIVIVIPSTLFLFYILWHLLKGIRELTGLTTEQILKS